LPEAGQRPWAPFEAPATFAQHVTRLEVVFGDCSGGSTLAEQGSFDDEFMPLAVQAWPLRARHGGQPGWPDEETRPGLPSSTPPDGQRHFVDLNSLSAS
jgi:hypothetical protein